MEIESKSLHKPLLHTVSAGKLKCVFFKFYKNGQFPLFSIGPSWPFMIILAAFVCLASFYLFYMLSMLSVVKYWQNCIVTILYIINIGFLIHAMFGDPGVKPSIYNLYLK